MIIGPKYALSIVGSAAFMRAYENLMATLLDSVQWKFPVGEKVNCHDRRRRRLIGRTARHVANLSVRAGGRWNNG